MDSQTPVSTTEIEVLTWLEVNKKRLLIGGGIALALIVIGVCVNHFIKQREVTASEELSKLWNPITSPNRGAPVASEKYLKIAEDYSGTKAGTRALILGAMALFEEGKFAEAKSAFEKFLREHPADPMAPQAALGIAACLDGEGKINEAINEYTKVSRQYSTEIAVSSQAKIALGRLLEQQNKFEPAYMAYRDLVDLSRAQRFNTWSEEAMQRMFQLEKAHPELASLNPFNQPKQQPVTITPTGTNMPMPKATNAAGSQQRTNAPQVKLLTGTNQPAKTATNQPLTLTLTNKTK